MNQETITNNVATSLENRQTAQSSGKLLGNQCQLFSDQSHSSSEQIAGKQSQSLHQKGSSPRDGDGKKRDYVVVSNRKRVQLIISVNELGLSCMEAATMLKIPYTNAKVIQRDFKVEKKVLANQRRVQRQGLYTHDEPLDIDSLRVETFELLISTIEKQQISKRTVNRLMKTNTRILFRMAQIEGEADQFDNIFKICQNSDGRTGRKLPIPTIKSRK